MRCRVTISRVVRQYADIEVSGVETETDAHEQVEASILITEDRERLLSKAIWFGTEDAVESPAGSLLVTSVKTIS